MAQRVPDGGAVFAVDSKLWPITGDWRLVVDQSALGLNVQTDRRHRLDDGKNREKRASIDTPSACWIGDSTPGVGHQFTVKKGGDLKTNFAPFANRAINGALKDLVCLRELSDGHLFRRSFTIMKPHLPRHCLALDGASEASSFSSWVEARR